MRSRRGFTLIELVIVIAIIGILASLAIPKFLDMSLQAKISSTKAGLGTLRSVLATRYAASATGGARASYPAILAASDFANGEGPRGSLGSDSLDYGEPAVLAVSETEEGTQSPWLFCPKPGNPQGACAYWYVSDSSSSNYGKSGAYSDPTGSIDTSSW